MRERGSDFGKQTFLRLAHGLLSPSGLRTEQVAVCVQIFLSDTWLVSGSSLGLLAGAGEVLHYFLGGHHFFGWLGQDASRNESGNVRLAVSRRRWDVAKVALWRRGNVSDVHLFLCVNGSILLLNFVLRFLQMHLLLLLVLRELLLLFLVVVVLLD